MTASANIRDLVDAFVSSLDGLIRAAIRERFDAAIGDNVLQVFNWGYQTKKAGVLYTNFMWYQQGSTLMYGLVVACHLLEIGEVFVGIGQPFFNQQQPNNSFVVILWSRVVYFGAVAGGDHEQLRQAEYVLQTEHEPFGFIFVECNSLTNSQRGCFVG